MGLATIITCINPRFVGQNDHTHVFDPFSMTRSFIFCLALGALMALPAQAVPFKQFEQAPAYTFGDAIQKPDAPVLQPVVPTAPIALKIEGSKQELVDIKMLKQRPAGAGGILPFRISDVRNQIDPEARSVPTTSGGTVVTTGGGSTGPTYTCPDGTAFPAAAPTSLSIDFLLPSAGGACQVGVSLSPAGDVAWRLGSATSTTANLVQQNGWSVSPSVVNISAIGTANAVTMSKGGVTYTLTVTISTNLASGMRAVITSFTRL